MSTQHSLVRVQGSQRGFTLIEIMIALLIGVFMLAALLTIVQANRATYGDQNQLAQLQDNERMAMTLMTDIIQSAGYFPVSTPASNLPSNTLDSSLTATTGDGYAFAIGQPMYGTHSATVPGDTIYVRYMTASGDGILNCSGLSNTTGVNTPYVNEFYIDANGQLVCSMNNTVYNLVSGVTNSTTTLGVTNMTISTASTATLPRQLQRRYLPYGRPDAPTGTTSARWWCCSSPIRLLPRRANRRFIQRRPRDEAMGPAGMHS